MPKFGIAFAQGVSISPCTHFGRVAPIVVEIGFGMGKATWQIAEANPDVNYLGIEVHTPGVGRLLMELEKRSIGNVRVIHHDALEVLQSMVLPESIAGFHIFYPDPWPKKRHHKRRLIQPESAELLSSRLVPGGYLYFVSDIKEYADWTLEILSSVKGLHNPFGGFAPKREWRPETRFESKGNEVGRQANELWFQKKQ
jgi:tRNA (guanine-N7-)-methyltransferase